MDTICALTLSLLCRAAAPRPACNYNQPEQTELANCDPSKLPYPGYENERQRYNHPRLCEKYRYVPDPNYTVRFKGKVATPTDKADFVKLNCPLG